MSEQINKVISEFTKQSENFNDCRKSFSKEEYNNFAISNMHLTGTEDVLEVAADTCAFGSITYLSVVISFSMFLINDIYGFINWSKMRKRQKADIE